MAKKNSLKYDSGEVVRWADREVDMACVNIMENYLASNEEKSYQCACYASALRAFKSLMCDDHSGTSLCYAQELLNRLIEHIPLTPIEGAWYEWDKMYDHDDYLDDCYYNRRMPSLLKYVNKQTGCVRYLDTERYTMNERFDPGHPVYNRYVNEILTDLCPIVMPYDRCRAKTTVHYEYFESNAAYEEGGYALVYIIDLEDNGDIIPIKSAYKIRKASCSEVITHYLRLVSSKERLESQLKELIEAKTEDVHVFSLAYLSLHYEKISLPQYKRLINALNTTEHNAQ